MQSTSVQIILYVSDQQISRDFYSDVLGLLPDLDVPGMTEFKVGDVKLGLMPEAGIRKIITPLMPEPSSGTGIPRCELYLLGNESSGMFDRAIRRGAKLISQFEDRDWGHKVAYAADPDGHILAFATESIQSD